MMDWYITRDNCNLEHRGQTIPPKVKLFLTSEQFKLHNTHKEQVVKCDPPVSESEVGVLADWEDWKANQPVEINSEESQKSKVKSQK